MMNKYCDWTQDKNGKLICATLSTVGGLHLLLTAPQPVLGFLPAFKMSVMGREIGAQQIVGGLLTVCGVCALGACCLPKKEALVIVEAGE